MHNEGERRANGEDMDCTRWGPNGKREKPTGFLHTSPMIEGGNQHSRALICGDVSLLSVCVHGLLMVGEDPEKGG